MKCLFPPILIPPLHPDLLPVLSIPSTFSFRPPSLSFRPRSLCASLPLSPLFRPLPLPCSRAAPPAALPTLSPREQVSAARGEPPSGETPSGQPPSRQPPSRQPLSRQPPSIHLECASAAFIPAPEFLYSKFFEFYFAFCVRCSSSLSAHSQGWARSTAGI